VSVYGCVSLCVKLSTNQKVILFVCFFVPLSQQNLVSTVRDAEMKLGRCVVATKMQMGVVYTRQFSDKNTPAGWRRDWCYPIAFVLLSTSTFTRR